MKKTRISLAIFLVMGLTISLIATTIAQAQTSQKQPSAKFDLIGIVSMLPKLEKNNKLALTKDQAEKILSLIKEYLVVLKEKKLVPREKLTLENAEKMLSETEEILSDKQLDFIDQLILEQMLLGQSQGKSRGLGQKMIQPDTNPFFVSETKRKLLMDLITELEKKLSH